LNVVGMLSKHPFELPPGRKLTREEVADALRLSIIAELDAVSLYLQLARAIDDEKVRRVFEDIAREEKTHVGEFLALLESMDPEQVEELKKGAKEVEELTGIKAPGGDDQAKAVEEKSGFGIEAIVSARVREAVSNARLISRKLPTARLGRGVDAAPFEPVGGGREVAKLGEIGFKFKVSQRAVDHAKATGQPLEIPDGLKAASMLASGEDKLIVEALASGSGVKKAMGDWGTPGQAVLDLAAAVAELAGRGLPRPYVVFLNPSNYIRLLTVSEKTGVTDLERARMIVDDIAASPAVPEEKVIVVSASPSVLDVVYGGDSEVDYIGPEEGGHAFKLWSTIAVRVRNPSGVVVLEKETG